MCHAASPVHGGPPRDGVRWQIPDSNRRLEAVFGDTLDIRREIRGWGSAARETVSGWTRGRSIGRRRANRRRANRRWAGRPAGPRGAAVGRYRVGGARPQLADAGGRDSWVRVPPAVEQRGQVERRLGLFQRPADRRQRPGGHRCSRRAAGPGYEAVVALATAARALDRLVSAPPDPADQRPGPVVVALSGIRTAPTRPPADRYAWLFAGLDPQLLAAARDACWQIFGA